MSALWTSIGIAVLAVGAGVIARWRYTRAGTDHDPAPLRLCEAAVLREGRHLAIVAALAALHADGLIEGIPGRRVRARGHLDPTRDPLERALHAAARAAIVSTATLYLRPAIAHELDTIDTRLRRAGLTPAPPPPRWVRLSWWAPPAVTATGLAAAATTGHPVGPTLAVALLVVLTAVAAGALSRDPRPRRRTVAAALQQLRRDYAPDTLAPGPHLMDQNGPTVAAVVALCGENALRRADPGFTDEILPQPEAAPRLPHQPTFAVAQHALDSHTARRLARLRPGDRDREP